LRLCITDFAAGFGRVYGDRASLVEAICAPSLGPTKYR
jgi:hypothetical protein